MDRQCVDAGFEFAGERFVDHAMALEPALSAERLRHDINPVMRLSARTVSGVPDVLMGFVEHPDALRHESLGQLLGDEIAPGHGAPHSGSDSRWSMLTVGREA
jgi:hypothetical protein